MQLGLARTLANRAALGKLSRSSAGNTTLRREADGSVTVLSVGKPYTPVLTRESDGSVTVGA